MICPHCKKPVDRKVPKEALSLAKKYLDQGHSMRSTEKLLFADGFQVSFATLSRHFGGKRK